MMNDKKDLLRNKNTASNSFEERQAKMKLSFKKQSSRGVL